MAKHDFPIGHPDIWFADDVPDLDELFGLVHVRLPRNPSLLSV